MSLREVTFGMLFTLVVALVDEFVLLGPGFKALDYARNITATTRWVCITECTRDASCLGFNYNNVSHQCEILVTKPRFYGTQTFMEVDKTWYMYEREPCGLAKKTGRHCHYARKSVAVYGSTWQNSRNSCVDMGLDLSVVVDESEATSLNADLTAANPTLGGGVWLGASSSDGLTMQWLDGTNLDYTYFSPEQQGTLTTESCLLAAHETTSMWPWRYHPCSAQPAFVCERRNDMPFVED